VTRSARWRRLGGGEGGATGSKRERDENLSFFIYLGRQSRFRPWDNSSRITYLLEADGKNI
jgi:hypothetical protein